MKYHKFPIIKSSGELESFSAKKLQRSIERAGLKPKYCKEIADAVSLGVKAGTSTRDIYNRTIKLVKKKSNIAATHYALKRSLAELGPTGYEFEYFVSKYFNEFGYKTYVGVVLQGQFVRHEVDVIASKPDHQIYVECKFHNNIGAYNDVKTSLYIKSRWDDLKNGPDGKYLDGYYIASNTSFSKDAIAFAQGVGLKLLGVNAPEGESFLEKIKKLKLYPITSLRRLKKIHQKELLLKKIILCKDLLDEKKTLLKMGLTESEINNIFKDINKLLIR